MEYRKIWEPYHPSPVHKLEWNITIIKPLTEILRRKLQDLVYLLLRQPKVSKGLQ